MGSHGAGGRSWSTVTGEWIDETKAVRPSGLGLVEVLCFGLVVGFFFYIATQREFLRMIDSEVVHRAFKDGQNASQLFVSFASTLAIYFVLLSILPIEPSVRLAGSMLATVVSVIVLYVSVIALRSVLASFLMVALAPGSAVGSRCGVGRAAAMFTCGVAAVAICLIHYFGLHIF